MTVTTLQGDNTVDLANKARTGAKIIFLSGYNLNVGIPADKANRIRLHADGTLAEVQRDFMSLNNEQFLIRPELFDTKKPHHREVKDTIIPIIGDVFRCFSIEVYCESVRDDNPDHKGEKIELMVDMGAFEKVIKVVDKLFPGSVGWRKDEPFVIFESKLAQVANPSVDQKVARYRLRYLINEARRQQRVFDSQF